MHSAKYLSILLAPAAIAALGSERIQSPDAKWMTITTPNYRIHYPANPKGGFEPFALEVASKIEGISAMVAEKVGFETKRPTDVIIQDPMMEANGATIPLLNRPVVLLWKTEPEPDSGIGHYDNWVDLLVTHELVHLHHLMRPSNGRRSRGKLLEMLFNPLPIGPITLKAPAMVIEGYATLLEGRITGSGRPHSAYRSAVVRQWALQGKLPSYEDVSGTSGFRGGAMPYLLGSAYLEWLESRHPEDPEILQKFWKQLASKKRMSYKEAFQATFGTDPKDSYDRWRAEVTYDAISQERSAKEAGLLREGDLVARFEGEITDLALSPDGTKLMARLLTRKKPGIKVWDLTADPEKDKKEAKKEKKPQEPDPNEVEDCKPEFVEPKELTFIGRHNRSLPRRAWWTGDSEITFELRQPDGEGVLKPVFKALDLKTKKFRAASPPAAAEKGEYEWKDVGGAWNIVKKLPNGQEQQITRTLSAAWQPAPTPDGKFLYYAQLSATGCEIRKLSLEQPELEPAPIMDHENMLTQGAVMSLPNAPSLLPQPDKAPAQAKSYSVWDSHHADFSVVAGYTVSPSSRSFFMGLQGSDILGRLSWRALGAIGEAMGPRGATFGVAYRGWRLAPSLEVFSSLEKPSAQKFAPVPGLDRERRGTEIAFTWEKLGLSQGYFRPVLAMESITIVDATEQSIDRLLAGAMLAYGKQWSRGSWGIGCAVALQGASGQTSVGEANKKSWTLLRDKTEVNFYTPAGRLGASVESGKITGDPTGLDLFSLGGQNPGIVPSSLNMNIVLQPAFPAFTQAGDTMERLRCEWGEKNSAAYAYFEWTAIGLGSLSGIERQRVAGLELKLDSLIYNPAGSAIGTLPSVTIGLHRPLDGIMKKRTVFTANIAITL
jgi:hypothetical protein